MWGGGDPEAVTQYLDASYVRHISPTLPAIGRMQQVDREVRTGAVPLRQIVVGSVGKAQYFARSFHPATDDIRQRWKRAFAAAHGLRGYEPIEL